jgi:iron complex outermembrane recepter protein
MGRFHARRAWIAWKQGLAVSCILAALMSPADPAYAQQSSVSGAPAQGFPGSPISEQSGPALEEVVVTAEKRESTVQKTPISITAISGTQLEAQGIADLVTAAEQVPGISFKSSGPGQTEFEMRGLSSSGGASPTVGMYIDETPVAPPAGSLNGKVTIDPNLYDLSRVEILRGPQGTLYGSGSMGGTIKLVTAPPSAAAFEARVNAIGSDTSGGGFNYAVNAMLNLPVVSDKLALRIVASDRYTHGWIDRTVVSPFPLETNNGTVRGNVLAAPVVENFSDVNDESLQGVRASLLLNATDHFEVTGTYLYQRIRQDGPSLEDCPPCTPTHYEPFDVPEPFSDVFSLGSLVGRYNFGNFNLTSATSYWKRTETNTQDGAENLQLVLGETQFIPDNLATATDGTHQFSQELRIASNESGALQWLGGLFYSDYTYVAGFSQIIPGIESVYGFGTPVVALEHAPFNLKQEAVFGEGSYKITDALKATLGLRYFTYSSHSTTSNAGIFAENGDATPFITTSQASDSGLNPKVNLSYALTDDYLLYTTAAKGYRPGAPNQPVPMSGADSCLPYLQALGRDQVPTQFKPDSLWSYEIGEKARFLGGQVTVNGAFYYEDWKSVQQAVTLGCGYNYQDNGGNAGVFGGELEVSARITPELTFSVNAGYTDATFTDNFAETGTVKGQKVLDVPDWTESTALAYTVPMSANYKFTGRISNDYVGSRDGVTYTRYTLPGYDLVRLRFGIQGAAFSAFIFADNAFNTRAILENDYSLSVNVPTFNRTLFSQPRTVGLDLNYHF